MRVYGEKVFAGAAKYYAKYRPQYPPEMFADIEKSFKLDGCGRLLDLGCGTGELAIPLAQYFEKVLALDPDKDMLKQGKLKANHQDIGNIQWKLGSSKDLTGVRGMFRLITMGQSFHWMDQAAVLEQLYTILELGGGLFIAGSVSAEQNRLAAKKDEIIKRMVANYLGPKRRAGNKFYAPPPQKYEDLLGQSKFQNHKQRIYVTRFTQNVDQIIGNLYSMSWALKLHFGSRIDDFEAELRHELLSISEKGKFTSQVDFEAYYLNK